MQIAAPFLEAARDRLHESISLAVLDRESALFVARSEAERLVTTGIAVGTRIDLYCSATGRVLLAAWPDDRVAEYLDRVAIAARTKYSIVKRAALRDAVRRARSIGYAYTDQELELGLRSIAVPVLDIRGTVVAAMSASASSARITLPQMFKGFVPVLRTSADRLGRTV